MQGKIALEEHFALEETVSDALDFWSGDLYEKNVREELHLRLIDITDRRLREMDQNGIEMTLLSLNAPAVQGMADIAAANDLARRANDYLAEHVARRPDRFQAFAALPMQDPELAARELERCVRDLGFRGAMVNGFSPVGNDGEISYYDENSYRPFWRMTESLQVPFYLHPRNPPITQAQIFKDHEWLFGPAWAFGQQTAVHSLRLIGSGLFDDCPDLQIILGHMGEGLPFSMWRIDHCNDWKGLSPTHHARNAISHYFTKNFYLTVSGNFNTPALINAIQVVGADRIMFATDWPFENIDHAAKWFDTAEISDDHRRKIGRTNANALFKLRLAA